MPSFNSLALGASTFIPTAPGYYSNSTRSFADPINHVKINGGKKNAKSGTTTASVTRTLEAQIPATALVPAYRTKAEITLLIQSSDGVTSATLDFLLTQLSDLLTPTMVDQIMQGAY